MWEDVTEQLNEEKGRKIDAAYLEIPPERPISDLSVAVAYKAHIGHTSHYMQNQEHIYRATDKASKNSNQYQWKDLEQNAFNIRDKFLLIKDPLEAYEFLQNTGIFTPLRDEITWTEFKRWQRFAYLVQEHNMLANAMRAGKYEGEEAEVLKALTGIYKSSFFDDCERQPTRQEQDQLMRFFSKKSGLASNINQAIHEAQVDRENKIRQICAYFLRPTCSIIWVPANEEVQQKILRTNIDPESNMEITDNEKSPILQGGAMIEYLLDQEELKPVLLIKAGNTLEAIAGAIYADRVKGVHYRACKECSALFRLGNHSTKGYCAPPKPCKSTAKKRRQRKNGKQKETRG